MRKVYRLLGVVILFSLVVLLWFHKGLLFAGAEEQLTFYNYTKSLELFSSVWYGAGTGYPTLSSLPRIPYFLFFKPLYQLGISNVLLQAITFLILILIGVFSVYFLIKITINLDYDKKWHKFIPLLSALFYFFNPFSMSQIWGRGLSYQFFSFALVPSFLLFFVLSLKNRNLIYCVIASIVSVLLSVSYLSPAVVITSWAAVGTYFICFLIINRSQKDQIFFASLSFICLLFCWIFSNFFWIYPTFVNGSTIFSESLTIQDNINSLKGLAPNSIITNVLRLIHREYYDGTYPQLFNINLYLLISWLLPIFSLFALPVIRKSKFFLFYAILAILSIFFAIGANFPTGGILIWLFKTFPLLQVFRNPYEKFGINLVIALTPFFAYGLVNLSENLSKLFRNFQLKSFFVSLFIVAYFIVLLWPFWNGSFAGGAKANFWMEVPQYYKEANAWFNKQPGDFRILHLPLIPEEGITYTWPFPYEGVEASEFIFDKSSISRNTKINSGYYSALLNNFQPEEKLKDSPYWSGNYKDFQDSFINELVKLNVRFVIVHFDTDFIKRTALDPVEIVKLITNTPGIKKVQTFGKLEVYQVDVPQGVQMIYSPDSVVSYKKVNPVNYTIYVKAAEKLPISIYFLEQYDPGWEAYIGSVQIKEHAKIFSYANRWVIDKPGDYEINLKYLPQESFYFGTRISLISLVILTIALIVHIFKTRYKFF